MRLFKTGPWPRKAAAMLMLAALAACATPRPTTVVADPLPSWNRTETKAAIESFVAEVSDKDGPNFVPVEQRVATFDNDGTLWVEQPIYTEVAFSLDQVRAMAPDHPAWRTEEPYASVLSGDRKRLARLSQGDLVEIVAVTHAGMTEAAFEASAKDWFATARHPRFDRLYPALTYQPQLELLRYLRANGFKTFIVSGGEVDFMRAFAPEAYGIPPDQIVGTSVKYDFEEVRGKPVLHRLPALGSFDDEAGKPVNIHLHIGRKPILAFGNSDGDLQMLQYADDGAGPRLMLLLHHDDAAREFAYDRSSAVGKLDKAWDLAKGRGWTVVSMKDDFKTVFADEAKDEAPEGD